MAHLLELSGQPHRTHELGPVTIIGRDPTCGIILYDPLISRAHVELKRLADGRYRLTDLSSMHGTFVGGQRVTGCLLQDNDEMQLGDTRLKFFARELPATDDTAIAVIAPPPAASLHPPPAASALEPQAAVAGAEMMAPEATLPRSGGTPPPPSEHTATTALGMRREFDRWRAAFALFNETAVDMSPDGILERVIDAALNIFEVDRAIVFIVDPETGNLVPRVAKPGSTDDELIISKSIAQDALNRRVCVAVNNADQDLHYGQQLSVVMSDIRSAMACPMLAGDEVHGLIFLDSRRLGYAFTHGDQELLMGIASILGLLWHFNQTASGNNHTQAT